MLKKHAKQQAHVAFPKETPAGLLCEPREMPKP
jgi:hypothetical protein